MKFTVRDRYHRYSTDELLADLRRSVVEIGGEILTRRIYDRVGHYSSGTISARFGSWSAALRAAGITSPHATRITPEACLSDLKSVAAQLGTDTVSLTDYRSLGRFSEEPFRRLFGGWLQAVQLAGLRSSPRHHARISDSDLFENIEQMWIELGRQPSYSEVHKPFSRYSAGTYESRFGSWRKALAAFLAHISQVEREEVHDLSEQALPEPSIAAKRSPAKSTRRTRRAPSLRLRFLVMRRDNFGCRLCGRSPAITQGVELHVDHIVPWESGGETELENLQTLCSSCNLGKSNLRALE